MKTLIVLAAGLLQSPAIIEGVKMGLRVVALDADPNAPGLKYATKARIVDITNPQNCLRIAKEESADGVIHICSEVAMASLGEITEKLSLHGLTSEIVSRATNKALMRKAFVRGGAPSPKSIATRTADEAVAAFTQIAANSIIKPGRNSGSRGVTFLEKGSTPDYIREMFQKALKESRDPIVLVEEFVDGPEFSVEAIVWGNEIHILAITDKLTTGVPHFVELGHNQPSRFGEEQRLQLSNAAKVGISALGLNWCAAHAEIRLSARGPVIMEIGARLGGDFITTELVPRSTGINMVQAAIRLSLGEAPDLTPKSSPRGAAIRYITPKPGVVTKVFGQEGALGMKGVKIVEVYKKLGDTVYPVDSSLARSGHVIAEGESADEAIRNAEAAVAKILIETK